MRYSMNGFGSYGDRRRVSMNGMGMGLGPELGPTPSAEALKNKFDWHKKDIDIRLKRIPSNVSAMSSVLKKMETSGWTESYQNQFAFNYSEAFNDLDMARQSATELLGANLITKDDFEKFLDKYNIVLEQMKKIDMAANNMRIAAQTKVFGVVPLGDYVKGLLIMLGGVPGLVIALNTTSQSLAMNVIGTAEFALKVGSKLPDIYGGLKDALDKLVKYLPWILGGAIILTAAPTLLGAYGASKAREIVYRKNPRRSRSRSRGRGYRVRRARKSASGQVDIGTLALLGGGAISALAILSRAKPAASASVGPVPTTTIPSGPSATASMVNAGSVEKAAAAAQAKIELSKNSIPYQMSDTGKEFVFFVPPAKLQQAQTIIWGVASKYDFGADYV